MKLWGAVIEWDPVSLAGGFFVCLLRVGREG